MLGGGVSYQEKVKTDLLKVSPTLIKKYTAESQQVTDAMAMCLSKIISSNISVAITGLASQGGSETKTKSVGTIFFSVYIKRKLYRERKHFLGTPLQIRRKACDYLYQWVVEVMNAA